MASSIEIRNRAGIQLCSAAVHKFYPATTICVCFTGTDIYMPRTKDESLHAVRKQQILKAARACFIKNGFHRTSMRQILSKAGISAGGAYNYFSGKDDIVIALVAEERADIEEFVEQLGSGNPLTGIAGLIHDIIRYVPHDDLVIAQEIYAEACRNPEIEKVNNANMDMLRDVLRSEIRRGVKQGVIGKTFTVNEYAEWIMALFEGYAGRLVAYPDLSRRRMARIAKDSILTFLAVK